MVNDSSGVASNCGQAAAKFAEHGLRVVRSITSRNERYGVVWRADLVSRDDPDDQTRFLCWRAKGSHGQGGYLLLVRPFEMSDKSDDIGPLQTEAGAAASAPAPVSPPR